MLYLSRFSRLFIVFIAALSSCAWAADVVPASGVTRYRIAMNDELNFRFLYLPELNTVATVRTDGHISLPIVGELPVEGLTLLELTEQVERLLSTQVRRPQVTVNLQGGTSQKVFVGGEVMRPGIQPLQGPLTVLQAVMVAEGLKESAQPRQVLVLRRGPAGTHTAIPVDLASAMSGRDLSQDLQLQAYDAVIVPRSGIADLGLWVDQYVKRVLPFSMGITYSINKGVAVQ